MALKEELKGVDRVRNVLVGVSLEKESKELLGWAIVKVAEPGDHVVALHVGRNSGDSSKEKQLLDDYVEIFKHLCHLKKVNLTGKILRGKSIRKALVKEAKHCAAIAVIVGITKIGTIGGWTSTGKYCAEHLPSKTKILTLHNGKVVFKRNSTDDDPLQPELIKPSQQIHEKSSRNYQFEFGDSESSELDSHSPKTIMGQSSSETRSSTDSSGESLENKHGIGNNINTVTKGANWTRRSVSLCTIESEDEAKPGWPLLRRTSFPTPRTAKDSSRKMSVVQWVMSLPNRSPPESPQSSSTDTCSSTKSESGVYSSRQRSHSMLSELMAAEQPGFPFEPVSLGFTWFSYEALRQATSQFSPENLIGKGGNSRVYKGVFEDGEQVAVKVVKSSKQARKDFSAEVNIMSSLRHKNITPLLGVCIANSELISVYQFMPNGSLEENLHGEKKQKESLSWEARYRVGIGIAEALVYLHNECSSTVIHRDVKSSNILLSDDYDPQLSDFGLAIWAPKSECAVEEEVEVVGTFGYMAPEYVMYGKVTDKVDVYSYGVVLLELLSGRKPILVSKESLVIWAKPILESGRVVKGLVDPSMQEGKWDEAQIQRMVVAASLCLTRDARHRPNMAQILRLLKGEESGETWASVHVSEQDGGENKSEYKDNDDEIINMDKLSCEALNVAKDDFTVCSNVPAELEPCIRLSLADLFKTKI